MPINNDLVPLLAQCQWEPISRLQPRSALEIGQSSWSIGLETIDRDYVRFEPLKPWLGNIGATQSRVQAGWARCEPTAGQDYDWAWLDEIVDGCLEAGVRPMLQTSYGNPAYEGGGGIGLGQGIPKSEAALLAWDKWVRSMAERYVGKVDTWEIWNEPLSHIVPTDDYTRFYIRTARILREIQPDSCLVALGLAHHDEHDVLAKFLRGLVAENATDFVDEVSFHFYPHNPDDCFQLVDQMRDICAELAPHVKLRQGETGAPSECRRFMAMGEFDWSERKQAAWNLRRMLAHHARGIPMNLFQLADMHYVTNKGARHAGRNPKGQLYVLPDKSVAYAKPSYYAAQHVFSILDSSYPLKQVQQVPARSDTTVTAYAWQRSEDSHPDLLAWWQSDKAPGLTTPDLQKVGLKPHRFEDPVLIDFMSGVVFTPPEEVRAGNPEAWLKLYSAESPLALAERAKLSLTKL